MKDVNMIDVIADDLARYASDDTAGESFASIPKIILESWAVVLHKIVEKNKTVKSTRLERITNAKLTNRRG